MSNITSLIFSFPSLSKEESAIIENKLSELVKSEAEMWDIKEIADFKLLDNHSVGGNRSLVGNLYFAAFNYLIMEQFINFVRSFKEIIIEKYIFNDMQVFIKLEHDDMWRIYTFENFNKEDFNIMQ